MGWTEESKFTVSPSFMVLMSRFLQSVRYTFETKSKKTIAIIGIQNTLLEFTRVPSVY